MVKTSFSEANIFNSFSGGSLLPGHTVVTYYLKWVTTSWTFSTSIHIPLPLLVTRPLKKNTFFASSLIHRSVHIFIIGYGSSGSLV